jgi:hypothetical protein
VDEQRGRTCLGVRWRIDPASRYVQLHPPLPWNRGGVRIGERLTPVVLRNIITAIRPALQRILPVDENLWVSSQQQVHPIPLLRKS